MLSKASLQLLVSTKLSLSRCRTTLGNYVDLSVLKLKGYSSTNIVCDVHGSVLALFAGSKGVSLTSAEPTLRGSTVAEKASSTVDN